MIILKLVVVVVVVVVVVIFFSTQVGMLQRDEADIQLGALTILAAREEVRVNV